MEHASARLVPAAHWAIRKELVMEIHTSQSLLAIHGMEIPPRRARGTDLINWASGLIGKAIIQFARWLRYRKGVAELHRLDDRMLADIGVIRVNIDQAARFGRWDTLADYRAHRG
jgi:uncharacterized protein YjiS (DUF1127 family)